MKIAQVSPAFHPAHIYGGPTYSALRLCEALAEAGGEVRVLTTDANGRERTLDVDTSREVELAPRFRVRYCHRIAVHAVSPSLVGNLPELLRWADVVHLTAAYNFTTFPTLMACRALGKPLVWSPRGGFQRWEGTTRARTKDAWDAACRSLAPRRLALHVTSQDEARQSLVRFPNVRAAVIPNGVDIPEPHAKEDSSVLRLLYLGRLHPIKGIENLLEACAKLGGDPNIRWSLALGGDGDEGYRSQLQARTIELGLSDSVRFMGDVRGDAKQALFHAADVVVVPSHSENFGIVVTEALAHGLPVIASRGTPWERLEEVGCGLWVANDPGSLADAIRRVAAMPRTEMGARARQWVESEFSWKRVARDTLALYESLVGPRKYA